jgi:hypothetical protein
MSTRDPDSPFLIRPASRRLRQGVDRASLVAEVAKLKASGHDYHTIAMELSPRIGKQLTADGVRKALSRAVSKPQHLWPSGHSSPSILHKPADHLGNGNPLQPNSDVPDESLLPQAACGTRAPRRIIILGPSSTSEAATVAMLSIVAHAALKADSLLRIDLDPVTSALNRWCGAQHLADDTTLNAEAATNLVSHAQRNGDVLIHLGPRSAGSARTLSSVKSLTSAAEQQGVQIVVIQALDIAHLDWERVAVEWLAKTDARATKVLFADEVKLEEMRFLATNFGVEVIPLPKIPQRLIQWMTKYRPINFSAALAEIESNAHLQIRDFYNITMTMFESERWIKLFGSVDPNYFEKTDHIKNIDLWCINRYWHLNPPTNARSAEDGFNNAFVDFCHSVRSMDEHEISIQTQKLIDAAKAYYAPTETRHDRGDDPGNEAPKAHLD